ncbi:MAG: hypothetical protein AAF632_15815 [Bacteroidota bacterium]
MLEFYYRDRFDRLLIAQETIEQIATITKESGFWDYKVFTQW